MTDCQTLIHAQVVITQNEAREILNDAGIAIQAGRIAAIGPWTGISAAWNGAEILDLSGHLVMPGLINSHAHAAMIFLRGLADDEPLMDWLTKTVFPAEARLTPGIVRLGSLLGYAEMLATGTTACVDMYIFEEAALEAAEIAGIRCLGGEAVFGAPSAACASFEAALEKTAELAERYRDHERIGLAVNPHSVYTTDAGILAGARQLALDLDLPLHIHLAETPTESAICQERHGMRPVAWCHENGLLDTRMIAAHLVDVTREEAELLGAKGVCGAHNPSSNMKLASGACPAEMLAASGVRLGIGTDGPASNNQLSMFAEMSRAALLAKAVRRDPAAMPAGMALDFATLGGAAVFGDPLLGRLAPGANADLIALDLSRPNLLPLHNPVSQVVYAASGHEVRLTMIGGEVVYRDGEFARFDYADLLKEIAALKEFAQK
ncbi:MAG: amidohydrolase [Desulfovibrio sp.]|nr:amidohydrolase [Desulfovibrio sp.]